MATKLRYTGPELFHMDSAGNRDLANPLGGALPLPEGMTVPDSWPVVEFEDDDLAARTLAKHAGSASPQWAPVTDKVAKAIAGSIAALAERTASPESTEG